MPGSYSAYPFSSLIFSLYFCFLWDLCLRAALKQEEDALDASYPLQSCPWHPRSRKWATGLVHAAPCQQGKLPSFFNHHKGAIPNMYACTRMHMPHLMLFCPT